LIVGIAFDNAALSNYRTRGGTPMNTMTTITATARNASANGMPCSIVGASPRRRVLGTA
jgi:hypothetical protein